MPADTSGGNPRSLLKNSVSRQQITAAPASPSSPSMSRNETPELLASLFGKRWPSIIKPYSTTGIMNSEICTCQAIGLVSASPAMKKLASPPRISPPGQPACRMLR